MGRTFKHLTYEQRTILKNMLDSKCSVQEIANALNFHRSAIYREIDRGTIDGVYNPDYSQNTYQEKLANMGAEPMLSVDKDLAEFISIQITEHHLSPEQIIEVLQQHKDRFSSIPKSHNTIYNAIDNGLIPNVTRDNLKSRFTKVFNNGEIHLARWVMETLNINDDDTLSVDIGEDNTIILKKLTE